MSLPIIKLVRKLVTGGTLKPVGWEFADSFTTTTANCSISTAGELLVAQGVAKVSLKANFPTGTTGTAFLAVKDKEPPSATKPTNITGWTIIGSGVTIASNSATFELSMSDTNGLSTNVGICAYVMKNTSAITAGTTEKAI
jgi:hypothetical protein